MTLHTASQCTIEESGFSGSIITPECYVNAEGQAANAGCGIAADTENSYGASFNEMDGGTYVMEWSIDEIQIWFFPRHATPLEILGGEELDPSHWGKPMARFYGDCPMRSMFGPQQIVSYLHPTRDSRFFSDHH